MKAFLSLTASDEFHRVILRLVTHEFLRVADIPIPACVVGDAEENSKGQVRADGLDQKLSQVARAAPFAMKLRLLAQEWALIPLEPADTHANHRQPVLVGIIA